MEPQAEQSLMAVKDSFPARQMNPVALRKYPDPCFPSLVRDVETAGNRVDYRVRALGFAACGQTSHGSGHKQDGEGFSPAVP